MCWAATSSTATTTRRDGTRADAGFGHGTHVAGLVALAAPGARLMPVRVLDAQRPRQHLGAGRGLAWAVDPDGNPATDDGAHVINLSLGGTATHAAAQDGDAAGGDCSFDDDDDDFKDPASTPTASAAHGPWRGGDRRGRQRRERRPSAVPGRRGGQGRAGRHRQHHRPASWRPSPTTAAGSAWRRPGEAIVSTVPGGGWGTWSGTSMAAPLAAGVAALVLQTLPPGGDPSLPNPRQWTPELVVKRVSDKAVALCGTSLKQLDAPGAVTGEQTPDQPCP
jgi:subtilisin family serine protease